MVLGILNTRLKNQGPGVSALDSQIPLFGPMGGPAGPGPNRRSTGNKVLQYPKEHLDFELPPGLSISDRFPNPYVGGQLTSFTYSWD